jgi:hypothetical protein
MDQLRGHSITYRIAVGPQQGRKVLDGERPELLHSCPSLVIREGQELADSTRLPFPSATRFQVIGNGKYPPKRTFICF